MRSRKGFRVTMGAVALAALVVGASPAAHAAGDGHRSPVAPPVPSFWQLLVGGIEARMVGALRQLGWGEWGHGGGTNGQLLAGASATVLGGATSSGPSGASSDQGGAIDPNGG